MTQHRKKLIEVALPLKKVNEQSARKKYIRHGYPSTLHLWWAQSPLAACRAVLFAQLVDDPSSDPAYRRPDGSVGEDRPTPCYIRQPFAREPDFGVTGVNYRLEDLLTRGGMPQ